NAGALSAIPYGNKVTEADTNAAGSEQGWYRYFPYSIDRTVGLNSIAKVSQDDSSYTQTKTIDNSSSPVNVYLRMSVENPLSENYGTLSKIRLIDMLPYSGDTMAISNSPKNSTGSLTGYEVYSVKVNDAEILFADLAAAGIQLYYSDAANFMTNRQELRNVTVSAAGHWTPLASANGIPDTAKAVMAEKDNFVSGDTLEIILKATAPASSDTNKYWHSIAAGGRYGANNIVPGEPTKSGFTGLGGNPVTVSGRVWNDTNQDGVQDVGETGYQGLIMTDQGNEADVTETGSNGEYSFTDDFDASSSWHIQFTLPDDYALTQYHAPAATASTNSDYSLYQGTPTVFYSFGAVTEDKINLDAGIYNTAVDYYTVTYHVNTPSGATGGSVPSAITGIESGDSAQLSAATAVPTRTDGSGTYSFKGWSTTVNPALDATIDYAGTGQIASVTDDVNLYAVWVFTATYWNLAYDVNLPAGAEQPSTAITLPAAQSNIPTGTASTATGSPTGVPVRTDVTGFYTFNGWKTSASGGDSYTAAQTVPAQSAGTTITLYAQWTFTGSTYTVTYHANTPSGAEPGTVPDALTNIPAGSSAQLSPAITVPTKSGGKYEFKGWSLTPDPELDADIDFAGNAVIDPVGRNYDLYAVWTWKKNPAGAETNSKDDDTKPSPTPVGAIFSDEHYAYVVGYPDGEVKPQNNITRAEVTTVFFRLLTEQNRSSNWRETNTYSDVNANDWFNNAVSVMSGMKVVNGYPDGSFNPNANISRAEVAVIAARFARQLGTGKTNTTAFSDIDGHWAKNDILFAASVGWINGYPDGTFEPDQPLTRAEFMALANRMLERVPEYEGDLLDNMVKWADNADNTAWYYLDVQEATNSHTYTRKITLVPKLLFKYERWELITHHKDWTLLER
ncbi:MAG: S-layer homology domain-containing protein, partial [Oscillospiraceae bacterium]|nr:S-layer homology domain-containing protein [Oscillospiraceae bacterium]